jgi:hypothetical protein
VAVAMSFVATLTTLGPSGPAEARPAWKTTTTTAPATTTTTTTAPATTTTTTTAPATTTTTPDSCAAPTNFQATGTTASTVSVAWGAVTGASAYDVWLGIAPNQPSMVYASGFTGTTATLYGLSDASSYTFAVKSVCGSATSALSNVITVTPGATSTTTTSTTLATTTTTTTAPTSAKATTRAVGSAPLSDADAAGRVSRSTFEPRPANATANNRLPSSAELTTFRSEYRYVLSGLLVDNVTGNFSGTTDEIIQWASHKWGFDEDVFRASAAVESWWDQSFIGDNGASPGLFQLRTDPYPTTYMLVRDSTPFNADLYGAMMRYYYDGKATWLNDPCCFSGTTYTAGDLWGTIGAHYSGRWYDSGANAYITKVKDYLARRVWAQPGF